MLRELRESYGLTRQDLADATGRSLNYLLKAESLTFPSVPVCLLNFYTNSEPPKNLALSEDWEPMDRDILESSYRDTQRTRREMWLDWWLPVPNKNFSFCRQWINRALDEEEDWLSPTEYRVSQGLCIPAAGVYRAEQKGHISQPIRVAFEDLVEYVASGRFTAAYPGDTETITGVFALAKKYGAKTL